MEASTSSLVFKIVGVVWSLTLVMSIVIMFGGAKLFRKAHKGEKTAMIPIINLFTMLEIADMTSFWGILFFVPIVNMLVIMMISWKVGSYFSCSTGFKIGLVVFPIVFFPLLFMSDKQYKMGDESYFKMMDNAHEETTNLMTQEEIKTINETVYEPEVEVDSIFKGKLPEIEQVGPYKATKIDIAALDKLKASSSEDDMFTPIKRVDENVNKPEYTTMQEMNQNVFVQNQNPYIAQGQTIQNQYLNQQVNQNGENNGFYNQ
jgi:hypothetical protein